MYEDEISLRYYIALLLKRWKWILLGGFAAALVAFAVTWLQPRSYEATAAVAIVRSRTDVQFDDRIETLDDYQLSGSRLAADRLSALLSLVDSNVVVGRVLEDVSDQLEPEVRRVDALRGMVESQPTGDLIEFTVSHEDPEVAAAVVNSWAQAYTRRVNQLYGDSAGNVEAIATQVVAARETYEGTQQALQEFLADKRVLELTRTLENELAIKQALLTAYQESGVAIETSDASTSSVLLENYYSDLNQIEVWLADAQTLRDQVANSSSSFTSTLGDALALVMLRAQIYGGAEGPVDLQLDLANADVEAVRVADVDNLIAVLETRRTATQERITVLTAALGSDEVESTTLVDHPLTARMDSLTGEIIELETRLETETAARTAQRLEMEAARDRAWEVYQALTAQQLEAEIKLQSSGEEVRVADLALVPTSPVGSRVVVNTVLAAIIGVMIGVTVVFFVEWWSSAEIVNRQDSRDVSDIDDHTQSVDQSEPVRGRQSMPDTAV